MPPKSKKQKKKAIIDLDETKETSPETTNVPQEEEEPRVKQLNQNDVQKSPRKTQQPLVSSAEKQLQESAKQLQQPAKQSEQLQESAKQPEQLPTPTKQPEPAIVEKQPEQKQQETVSQNEHSQETTNGDELTRQLKATFEAQIQELQAKNAQLLEDAEKQRKLSEQQIQQEQQKHTKQQEEHTRQQQEELTKQLEQHSIQLEQTVKELQAQIASRDDAMRKISDSLEEERGSSFSFKLEAEKLKRENKELFDEKEKLAFDNMIKSSKPSPLLGDSKSGTDSNVSREEHETVVIERDQLKERLALSEEKTRDSQKQVEIIRTQLLKQEQECKNAEGRVQKAIQEREQLQQQTENLRAEMDKLRVKQEQEVATLKEEKVLLTRKYYHHAFLAVKLKLQDKNFSLPELVEMAMKEQVDEQELNNWITKKLGLKSL